MLNSQENVELLKKFIAQEYDAPVVDWHSQEDDADDRQTVYDTVLQLLRLHRPPASGNLLNALTNMATLIEERLYYSADSSSTYSDLSTLVQRIEEMVKEVLGVTETKSETDKQKKEEKALVSSQGCSRLYIIKG